MAESTLCAVEDYVAIKTPDAETPIVPSAEEVFSYAFQGSKTLRGHAIGNVAPDDLKFSRFPADLKISLHASPSESGLHIKCNIVAQADKDTRIVSNVMARIADHIVICGTWYPFVPGALDRIRETLRSAGVDDSNRLTLANYLVLSRADYRDYVEDQTDHRLDADRTATAVEGTPPSDLRGTLYQYQLAGYNWLRTVCNDDIGCILADEMGLGKTIQVIALLLHERLADRKPSLVVVPATLIENWSRELGKFAPSLNLYIHRGASRTGFPKKLQGADVVVMSYDTLVRDISMVRMVKWNIMIADEAQAIKNPDTKRSVITKTVPRRATVAVTGTPLENRVRDLWSITDFVIPGLLGRMAEFEARYANSILDAARIEPIVTPILLRRRVADVASDLPPRIDIPQPIELGPELTEAYEALRSSIETEYGDAATLVSLGKLRQFCVHPFQLTGESGDPALGNNKYLRFLEVLDEIFANKEKALVFVQYHHATDLFCRDLASRFGLYVDWIDGRIPISDRQKIVDRFSENVGSAVLMLNPRTAGTGLNLTAANHVIHYGPDWNPAVEDQASARSHRRGQPLPVTVHRLFFVDTVEDVIIQRLEFKRQLARHAVVGTTGDQESRELILRALRTSPMKRRTPEHEN